MLCPHISPDLHIQYPIISIQNQLCNVYLPMTGALLGSGVANYNYARLKVREFVSIYLTVFPLLGPG